MEAKNTHRWLNVNAPTSLMCMKDLVIPLYVPYVKCSSGSCPDNEKVDKYLSLSFTPKPDQSLFGSVYECIFGKLTKKHTLYAEKLVVNATLVNPISPVVTTGATVVTIGGSIAGAVIGGIVTGGLATAAAGLAWYYYKNSRLPCSANQDDATPDLEAQMLARMGNASVDSEQDPENEAGTEDTTFIGDTNNEPANSEQPEEE